GAVMQRDFDVFLAHARKLDDGDDVIVVLIKIERRSPAREELLLPRAAAQERQIEQSIEVVPQARPAIERRPHHGTRGLVTNETHMDFISVVSLELKDSFLFKRERCHGRSHPGKYLQHIVS